MGKELSEESKQTVVAGMGATMRALRKATSEGGYFYFVSDKKGLEGALVALDATKKTADQKVFRTGRGVLKAFKDSKISPVYCQGQILDVTPLTFQIQKGNAKPATMKMAFKKSKLLQEVLGGAGIGLLKGARFSSGSADPTAGASDPEEPVDPSTPIVEAEVKEWMNKEENQKLIAEYGLDEEEIRYMLSAEKELEQVPQEDQENAALEERQAEMEARLDAIHDLEKQLASIPESDLDAQIEVEQQLNEARASFAETQAFATFDENNMSEEDMEGYKAALAQGLDVILRQLEDAQAGIQSLRTRNDSGALNSEELEQQKKQWRDVLRQLQEKFEPYRSPEAGVV